MSNEPTGVWAEAMERVGATDPRNGRPSWNKLGELAGVSTTTITNMVNGRSNTSTATVRKVAAALRVEARWVSDNLGMLAQVGAPYTPPAEADLLTVRQRKAVDELIRAIAIEQGGGGDERSAAPMTRVTSESDWMPSRTDPPHDLVFRTADGKVHTVQVKQAPSQGKTLHAPENAEHLAVLWIMRDGDVEAFWSEELPESVVPAAARSLGRGRRSEGQKHRAHLAQVGEDNQDPGDTDPA